MGLTVRELYYWCRGRLEPGLEFRGREGAFGWGGQLSAEATKPGLRLSQSIHTPSVLLDNDSEFLPQRCLVGVSTHGRPREPSPQS